jgi:hypothetical protein
VSDKVDAAVARVARHKPRAVVLEEQTIAIAQEPIVVRASGEVGVTRSERSDPTIPNVLLWDPQLHAWRAVLLPPGTSWELVEKRQGPTVWRPGMRT